MKKWMFVIFPGILLIIFLFFYQQTSAETAAKEKAHTEAAARQKAEDAARKAEIEQKARVDADKRAADAAAEEARKEADAAAKKKAARDKIRTETEQAETSVDRYNKDIADLQLQLDALQKQREQDNTVSFDLSKQVEQARVAERDAELEAQRIVDIISQHASKSFLTRLPAPPAAPPSE